MPCYDTHIALNDTRYVFPVSRDDSKSLDVCVVIVVFLGHIFVASLRRCLHQAENL